MTEKVLEEITVGLSDAEKDDLEEMIKAFIRQPSKFRYTQMPDHPDLSDQDLDNLYSYFQHQDQHRTQHSDSQ